MNDKQKIGFAGRVKNFFGGATYMPTIDITGGGGDTLTVNEYTDKTSQMKANIGWVYAVNQVIADDCSAVELKLFRKKPDGDQEEVPDHEILDLIGDPNMAITARQLWNLYYQYLNLTGETYILKLDSKGEPLTDPRVLPSALFPLPSHLCNFKLGETSWLDSTINYSGINYPITAVLRDVNPDPENPYVGMSVVRKSSLTIDTDMQMKRWNNKLFKNGARPGVVVEVPDKLKDDEYKRLKQQFDEQYRGTDNAFNRVLLEGGAKISPFMMTQQDLDFLESKRFTRDEILAMFRVSKSNLGITEDVNRANAEAQEYAYAKRIIKPRLDQFVDFINKRLLKPIYGNEFIIGYENPVPDDLIQRLNEANAGVNKWLTIDEVRDMYGYEALPDGVGTQLYVPVSSIPISEVATMTAPEPPQPTETPKPSENPNDKPNEPTDAPTDDTEGKDFEQRNIVGMAKADEYTKLAMGYEKLILRASRKTFDTQKKEVKVWLDQHLDKNWKSKDWASDMVDWSSHTQSFAKDLDGILSLIIAEIGEEAYNKLVSTGGFDAYTEAIRTYTTQVANQASLSVNTETEKQIRATLANGIRDDETVAQLQARVLEVFGEASTSRAFTIAQTESANAQGYADVQAWEQTGVVEGKEWFTSEDKAVCGFCGEMDGKVVDLSTNYFDKGESVSYTDSKGNDHTMKLDYRAVGHPPIHPNCRCVLLPILIK